MVSSMPLKNSCVRTPSSVTSTMFCVARGAAGAAWQTKGEVAHSTSAKARAQEAIWYRSALLQRVRRFMEVPRKDGGHIATHGAASHRGGRNVRASDRTLDQSRCA